MALAIKSNLEGRFHVGENGVAFLRGGRGKGKVRTRSASTFFINVSGAHAFSLYTEPLSNQDAVLSEQERRPLGAAPAKPLN